LFFSFVILAVTYRIDSLAGESSKNRREGGERARKRLVLLLGIDQINLFTIFPYPLQQDLLSFEQIGDRVEVQHCPVLFVREEY
jgi:hypothetical protein